MVLACASLLSLSACAQLAAQYKPKVGQEGRDVVWVPSSNVLVEKMLDMAKLTANDIHYDLGSGDGRMVIAAAQRGARSHGIEYNPDLVELSRRTAQKAGVAARATFEKADLFETDLSKATVITLFLLPTINLTLRPKLLDLKPGTRIVSNTFDMGDWEPDKTATASLGESTSYYRKALLWIVPAKVAGTWTLEGAAVGEITFKQAYQKFIGILNAGGASKLLANGQLRGDQIGFSVGATHYSGTVSGNTISGSATTQGVSHPWSATRGNP